jgi:hypothetical protein
LSHPFGIVIGRKSTQNQAPPLFHVLSPLHQFSAKRTGIKMGRLARFFSDAYSTNVAASCKSRLLLPSIIAVYYCRLLLPSIIIVDFSLLSISYKIQQTSGKKITPPELAEMDDVDW